MRRGLTHTEAMGMASRDVGRFLGAHMALDKLDEQQRNLEQFHARAMQANPAGGQLGAVLEGTENAWLE